MSVSWSVKGVERDVRKIAKDRAAEAGLTIGGWIDAAIRNAAAPSENVPLPQQHRVEATEGVGTGAVPIPPVSPLPAVGKPPDFDLADRLSEIEAALAHMEASPARIDSGLKPVGERIRDLAEQLVRLEKLEETMPPPRPLSRAVAAAEPGARDDPDGGEPTPPEDISDWPDEPDTTDDAYLESLRSALSRAFQDDQEGRVAEQEETRSDDEDDVPAGMPGNNMPYEEDTVIHPLRSVDTGPDRETPPMPRPTKDKGRANRTVARRPAARRRWVGWMVGLAAFVIGGLSTGGLLWLVEHEKLPLPPELQTRAEDVRSRVTPLVQRGLDASVDGLALARDLGRAGFGQTVELGRDGFEWVSQQLGSGVGESDLAESPENAASEGIGEVEQTGPSIQVELMPADNVIPGPTDLDRMMEQVAKAFGASSPEQKMAAVATLMQDPDSNLLPIGLLTIGLPEAGADRAANAIREAAISGNEAAQYALAIMHLEGRGLAEDEVRALLWFHSAAEQGNRRAAYMLGRLYAEGIGIPQDYAEAERWYLVAAEGGLPNGFTQVGLLYQGGVGVPRDLDAAKGFYERAIAAGDNEAERYLLAIADLPPDAPPTVPADPPMAPEIGAADGRPDESAVSPDLVGGTEQMLFALGFDPGQIDGTMTDETRSAIRAYQRRVGLPVDGLPSQPLLDHMISTVSTGLPTPPTPPGTSN